MAAFVQYLDSDSVAGSVITGGAWGVNPTAGNAIIVGVSWLAATGTVTSVTDNQSNTYSQVGTYVTGQSTTWAIFAAFGIVGGGALTLTVNLSGALSTPHLKAFEVSGITSTTDGFQGDSFANVTPQTSTGFTTTTANDFLVLFRRGGSVSSWGGGFTAPVLNSFGAYQVATTTGLYKGSVSLTASANGLMLQAAFKASTTIPSVSVQTASSISTTGATLNGNITSIGGSTVTVEGFDYGLTTSYGTRVSNSGSFGTGAFSIPISGLQPGTLYHYRAFGSNTSGEGDSGDQTFSTFPTTPPQGVVRYDGNTCPSLSEHAVSTSTLWDFTNTTWPTPADSTDWWGFDAGVAVVPSAVVFSPTPEYSDGAIGCILQGNVSDPTFTTGNANLFTVATRPRDGTLLNTGTISTGTAYRYYRFLVNSTNSRIADFYVLASFANGALGTTADPVASPPGGHYALPTRVTLSSPTTDATIWYTADGTTPAPNQGTSQQYTGPITLSSSCQLQAIAVRSGVANSRVISYNFYVQNEWVTSDQQYDVSTGYKMWTINGQVMYDPVSGYWYLYGVNLDDFNSTTNHDLPLSIYKSADLRNWQFVQPIDPPIAQTAGSMINSTLEQRHPRFFYNASTGKYICWTCTVQFGSTTGTLTSYSAPSPTGPWTLGNNYSGTWTPTGGPQANNPLTIWIGDGGGFQDVDGSLYILKITNNNNDLLIVKTSSDYLSLDNVNYQYYPTTTSLAPFNQLIEAPSMTNVGGTYFLMYSGQTSYTPNTNFYSTASSPLPASWTGKTNPFQSVPGGSPDNTVAYSTQNIQFLKIPGRGNAWVYVGDRWAVSSINGGTNNNFQASIRVILPTVAFSGSTVTINWLANWNIDSVYPSDGTASPAAASGISGSMGVSSASISWANNEPKAANIYLDRATDLLFTQNLVSQVLASGATSFVDSTVNPASSYFYRVRTVNASGTTNSQALFLAPGGGASGGGPMIHPASRTLLDQKQRVKQSAKLW